MARPSSTPGSTRGGSGGAWKFAGASAAVVAGGITVGYLFGNARAVRPPEQPVPPSATVLAPPAPGLSPSSIRPHSANGNYTAPNAPRITIREERTPVLRRTPQPAPDTPPADTEASQEATPTPRLSRRDRHAPPQPAPADSTPAPLDSNPATTPAAVNAGPAAPDAPTKPAPPAPPPAANPDPDFEQVTPRGGAPSGTPASGAGGGHHA